MREKKRQKEKKMKKYNKICLEVVMVITSVIYPGCMAMLAAAGWRYNVDQGNYPEIFGIYSFWMYLGAGLILMSMIMNMIGKKPKFYILNFISMILDITGVSICYRILEEFCDYADQHFSGIGEEMKPVSALYQERLMPVIIPGILLFILSIWNFLESRSYRIGQKKQKLAEAPKIIEED